MPTATGSIGRRAVMAFAGACASAGVLGQPLARSRHPPAFERGARVLLADVEVPGGEGPLGSAIGAALAVALSQSRGLYVVPPSRVASMARRSAVPVAAPSVARALEFASREGIPVVVAARVLRRGEHHALEADLIDVPSRAAFAIGPFEARRREVLLDAVDALAAQARSALGESGAAIAESNVPVRAAGSASLEALALYGDALWLDDRDEVRSRAMLQQAIGIDAEFAAAIAELAWSTSWAADRALRQEAERLFIRAIALPKRLTARQRLWLVPLFDDMRGQRESAVAGFRAFVAQYPGDVGAWFRLGWALMAGLGDAGAAADAFVRVTELDPGNAGAWVNLATCHRSGRRWAEAVQTYHRAFALDADLRLGLYVNGEYGAALVELGRIAEARAAYAAMQAAPDEARRSRGHRSMGFLLMYEGRYRAALSEFDDALRHNADTRQALSTLRDRSLSALAHAALGEVDPALQALRAAAASIEETATSPSLIALMVTLAARLGDAPLCQRLAAAIERAIGDAAASSEVNRNLGQDNGFLDLARSEVERLGGRPGLSVARAEAASLRLSPKKVLATWARALQAAGRVSEAAAKYRQLIAESTFGIEEQEEATQAHLVLAGIEEQRGRRPEARAVLERLAARWHGADPEVLRPIRARLKALGA